MTLRNRVSVAAAVGVLIVVAAVSGVLYFSYAASLQLPRRPALVDAAQQANRSPRRIKQSAGRHTARRPTSSKPVTVGSMQVQLFPGSVAAGQPTRFGPLDSRDVAVAEAGAARRTSPTRATAASEFRVYTAAMPGNSGGAGPRQPGRERR